MSLARHDSVDADDFVSECYAVLMSRPWQHIVNEVLLVQCKRHHTTLLRSKDPLEIAGAQSALALIGIILKQAYQQAGDLQVPSSLAHFVEP